MSKFFLLMLVNGALCLNPIAIEDTVQHIFFDTVESSEHHDTPEETEEAEDIAQNTYTQLNLETIKSLNTGIYHLLLFPPDHKPPENPRRS